MVYSDSTYNRHTPRNNLSQSVNIFVSDLMDRDRETRENITAFYQRRYGNGLSRAVEQRIYAIYDITQAPANRNRTVLYPAELVSGFNLKE